MISFNDGILKIETAHTAMLIKEHDTFAELLYYGKKLNNITGVSALGILKRTNAHASVDNYDTYNTLCSFFGDGNDQKKFLFN